MSNSVFQSVIVQLRDISDRVFGVIDIEGLLPNAASACLLAVRTTTARLRDGTASSEPPTAKKLP